MEINFVYWFIYFINIWGYFIRNMLVNFWLLLFIEKKIVIIFFFLLEFYFLENESCFWCEYVLEIRKWIFIKVEVVLVYLLFFIV